MFGWVLLGLTVLSLIGEMAARGLYSSRGYYISTEELWAALAPESFGEFRAAFRSWARPLWIYVLGPLLKLPAWLLFGFPGILAFEYARRLDREPLEYNIEGAFLYEELVKDAKAKGYMEIEDRAPEDSYGAIAASAREAEAEMIRDPIVLSPRIAEETKAEPQPRSNGENPPRLNRPPS